MKCGIGNFNIAEPSGWRRGACRRRTGAGCFVPAQRQPSRAPPSKGQAGLLNSRSGRKVRLATEGIFRRATFFSCMRVQSLYSSNGGLASRYQRASFALGGREKKIEHRIAPRAGSLPGNSVNKKGSRKTDVLAACCCDVLHGVRGHLWNRSHHLWRGLRTWHSRLAFPSDSLVPADGVHDRRAFERFAR